MDTKTLMSLIMSLIVAQNVHSAFLSQDEVLPPATSSSSITSLLLSDSGSILLSKKKDKELKYEVDEKSSEGQSVSLELDDFYGIAQTPKINCDQDRFAFHLIGKRFMSFGIYDGHGGEWAADYAAQNFPKIFYNIWKKRKTDKNQTERIELSLNESFWLLDQHMDPLPEFEKTYNYRPSGDSSGTTALVALVDLRMNTLYVANAGDCRAVSFIDGVTKVLSKDHDAGEEEEKERVAAGGGKSVLLWGYWRIMGTRVARSLGDSTVDVNIIPMPEISKISFSSIDGEENNYFVAGSDGYWASELNSGEEETNRNRKTILRINQRRSDNNNETMSELARYISNQIVQSHEDDKTFLFVNLSKIQKNFRK